MAQTQKEKQKFAFSADATEDFQITTFQFNLIRNRHQTVNVNRKDRKKRERDKKGRKNKAIKERRAREERWEMNKKERWEKDN